MSGNGFWLVTCYVIFTWLWLKLLSLTCVQFTAIFLVFRTFHVLLVRIKVSIYMCVIWTVSTFSRCIFIEVFPLPFMPVSQQQIKLSNSESEKTIKNSAIICNKIIFCDGQKRFLSPKCCKMRGLKIGVREQYEGEILRSDLSYLFYKSLPFYSASKIAVVMHSCSKYIIHLHNVRYQKDK